MFIGEYNHNLDSKGRIIIPAKFRDELEGTFILTRGLDGCLTIYSLDKWEKIFEEINTLQIMIIKDWEPSVCPRCNERFSAYEDCDDGYYRRAYSLERCPYCGQKVKWE